MIEFDDNDTDVDVDVYDDVDDDVDYDVDVDMMTMLMMTLMIIRNRKRRQGGGQPAIFIEGGLLSYDHCNSDDGPKSVDNEDRPKASTPASGSVRPR